MSCHTTEPDTRILSIPTSPQALYMEHSCCHLLLPSSAVHNVGTYTLPAPVQLIDFVHATEECHRLQMLATLDWHLYSLQPATGSA